MKRVVIYGTGNNCEIFLKYSKRDIYEIVGFVDGNKYGTIYHGLSILRPAELPSLEYDEILVTPQDGRDIIKELEHEFHVDGSKIIDANGISERYILPQIEEHRYILFCNGTDYIENMYRGCEDSGKLIILNVLHSNKPWKLKEPYASYNNKIVLFGSYDYERYYDNGFFSYIKAVVAHSKYVLMFYDMIHGERGYNNIFQTFSIKRCKRIFDLLTTYHIGEAKEFGMLYKPYPYTANLQACDNGHSLVKCDLFFVGHSKDRLELLHSIYLRASDRGLVCHFWITAVPENKQLPNSNIVYNKELTYDKYLQEMRHSKTILEICQKGDETSYRYQEAVVYKKKLLLNDPTISEREYYQYGNFLHFENENDIDYEWIREPLRDYEYKDDFLTSSYLSDLENLLSH